MGFLSCCFGTSSAAAEDVDVSKPSDLTPGTPAPVDPATPEGPYRFVFDDSDPDRVTGLKNSGSKYAADKPIQTHNMPYEERIQLLLLAEEEARAKQQQRT